MRLSSFTVGLLVLAAGHVQGQGTPPPASTQPGTSTSCNKWHVVKSGDNCGTLESLYKITHAQFLTWNPAVSNDCITNFWPDYAYCVGISSTVPTTTAKPTTPTTTAQITSPPGPTFTGTPANCNNWYTIQKGDDCGVVEKKFGITHDQFIAWNPAVSKDCVTNFWPDYSYCVGVDPSKPSTATSKPSTTTTTNPSTTTKPSVTVPTTTTPYSILHPVTNETISRPPMPTEEWPPTKTQEGQPAYCNNWHLVSPGETCEDITRRYSTWMGLEDFFAWNPSLGTDCSGLYTNYFVCVGIQPQQSLTLVRPAPNGTAVLPPYFSWTPEPLPTVDTSFVPTPIQGPLPTDCAAWYLAKPGDRCDNVIAANPPISREQFFAWNSYLNNNCDGLWADTYYCVWAGSNKPPVPTATAAPSPVESGTVSTCTAWYQTSGSDDCDSIALVFGTFSAQDFVQWNPAVGPDCSRIRNEYYYCVAVPGTPTTRTQPIPSTTAAPDRPTQSGIASACGRYWLVSSVDTCDVITSTNGITLTDFLTWNPSVGSSSCTNLVPDYYVCVGLTG